MVEPGSSRHDFYCSVQQLNLAAPTKTNSKISFWFLGVKLSQDSLVLLTSAGTRVLNAGGCGAALLSFTGPSSILAKVLANRTIPRIRSKRLHSELTNQEWGLAGLYIPTPQTQHMPRHCSREHPAHAPGRGAGPMGVQQGATCPLTHGHLLPGTGLNHFLGSIHLNRSLLPKIRMVPRSV